MRRFWLDSLRIVVEMKGETEVLSGLESIVI